MRSVKRRTDQFLSHEEENLGERGILQKLGECHSFDVTILWVSNLESVGSVTFARKRNVANKCFVRVRGE